MFPFRDHNPSSQTPLVTWALIVLNVAIHLWQAATFQTELQVYALYDSYAMVPAEVSVGQDLLALVTSTFLHGGWMHLIGNMLFLHVFGDNLVDALGRFGFLLFYLVGGVGAGLCQWAADPLSGIPTVGASGAIAAVMGGYLLLFPKARVDVLIFIIFIIRIIPIPAWIVLAIWFVFQILGGFEANADMGGVAYWAHVGGFAIGFVMMVPAWLKRGGAGWWSRTEGHPPHADAAYESLTPTRVPVVRRRR